MLKKSKKAKKMTDEVDEIEETCAFDQIVADCTQKLQVLDAEMDALQSRLEFLSKERRLLLRCKEHAMQSKYLRDISRFDDVLAGLHEPSSTSTTRDGARDGDFDLTQICAAPIEMTNSTNSSSKRLRVE